MEHSGGITLPLQWIWIGKAFLNNGSTHTLLKDYFYGDPPDRSGQVIATQALSPAIFSSVQEVISTIILVFKYPQHMQSNTAPSLLSFPLSKFIVLQNDHLSDLLFYCPATHQSIVDLHQCLMKHVTIIRLLEQLQPVRILIVPYYIVMDRNMSFCTNSFDLDYENSATLFDRFNLVIESDCNYDDLEQNNKVEQLHVNDLACVMFDSQKATPQIDKRLICENGTANMLKHSCFSGEVGEIDSCKSHLICNMFGIHCNEDWKVDQSVCKLTGPNIRQGTGFVLFNEYIVTNGHLFEHCMEGQYLKQDTYGWAEFNIGPNTYIYKFDVICFLFDDKYDFALLKLILVNQTYSQTDKQIFYLPPGLLNTFSPLPLNKGDCKIWGYPDGHKKKLDSTYIIPKQYRKLTLNDKKLWHINRLRGRSSQIINTLKKQGIEDILIGGIKADDVFTYETCMGPGSSGSPVLNDQGVIGLHTGGYCYPTGKANDKIIVLGFGQPVLPIFKMLLNMLKQSNMYDLLHQIEKEAIGNIYLEEIIRNEVADDSCLMEVDKNDDKPIKFD
ncbi:Protein FAM111B Cancer-associated nucleoprotein [Channa argus]|uniref:Protein FAM111B Cancer-associated nucleoprotein n=1 Tax=Channa argus TaxID=215402 RepID=A0A6G1Q699_CHAAH|nr:Protein FAM111B Cancer-associated nucleoprotein [Channa argus]